MESEAKINHQNKLRVVLVSPAAADANNGNWHTAHRWSQFLSGHCDTTVCQHWPTTSAPIGTEPQVLIALHARRSADSVTAWAAAYPTHRLILVLTGTDLYRDILTDASAQQSLHLATQLVVLQGAGLAALPVLYQAKARVIYQSAPRLTFFDKSRRDFCAVMVGHLREEKDPLTFMSAAALLCSTPLKFEHIGQALEPLFETAAHAAMQANPNYRWLGGLPRAKTRQHIKRAHVLVIASRMEGGAHVVLEAVQSGTPVLASRISGNVGMLGADYAGYFELGNAAQLATLLQRCSAEPAFLAQLQQQCAQRADLFDPHEEKRRVINLVLGLNPSRL